jgi:hypothetical protein
LFAWKGKTVAISNNIKALQIINDVVNNTHLMWAIMRLICISLKRIKPSFIKPTKFRQREW